MTIATRLAARGHGGAEPNPLVGCVVVDGAGTVIGQGFHRRCGGPHAEIHALRDAGPRARGATVYVTLEPCNHTGRTGPCAEALIEAGVGRVVAARRDPNPPAGGGLERLRAAGIAAEELAGCAAAVRLSEPFAHRVHTGLPWVTVKWAQSLDGRIATRAGESQWISGPASRRLVHRERGRVDAILTGIGTVLADDPLLTARVRRPRRVARRVVVDPGLRVPVEAQLVRTAGAVPTTVVCAEGALAGEAAKGTRLREAGVELVALPDTEGSLPLDMLLRRLVTEHDVTNVLVEGGGGLAKHLFRAGLVNEAWVFVAPLILGDDAVACAGELGADRLEDGVGLSLIDRRERAGDLVLRYDVRAAQ